METVQTRYGRVRLVHPPHIAQPVSVFVKRLVDGGILHPPGFDALPDGTLPFTQVGGFTRLYLDEHHLLHLIGVGQSVEDDEIDRGGS